MTSPQDQTGQDPLEQDSPLTPPASIRADRSEDAMSQPDVCNPDLQMPNDTHNASGELSDQQSLNSRLQNSGYAADGIDAPSSSGSVSKWVTDYGEKSLAEAESLFQQDDQASAYNKVRATLGTVLRARSALEEDYFELLAERISLDKPTESPRAIFEHLKDYIKKLEDQISDLITDYDKLNSQNQVSMAELQHITQVVDRQENLIGVLHARLEDIGEPKILYQHDPSVRVQISELEGKVQRLSDELKGEKDIKQRLEEQLSEAEREIADATNFQLDSYQEMLSLHFGMSDLNFRRVVQQKESPGSMQQPFQAANSDSGVLATINKTLHDELNEQIQQYTTGSHTFENPRPAPRPPHYPQDPQDWAEVSSVLSQPALSESPLSLEITESTVLDCALVPFGSDIHEIARTASQSLDLLAGDDQSDASLSPVSKTRASLPVRQTQVGNGHNSAINELTISSPQTDPEQVLVRSSQSYPIDAEAVDSTSICVPTHDSPQHDTSTPQSNTLIQTSGYCNINVQPNVRKSDLTTPSTTLVDNLRELEGLIDVSDVGGTKEPRTDISAQNSDISMQKHHSNRSAFGTSSPSSRLSVHVECSPVTTRDDGQSTHNGMLASATNPMPKSVDLAETHVRPLSSHPPDKELSLRTSKIQIWSPDDDANHSGPAVQPPANQSSRTMTTDVVEARGASAACMKSLDSQLFHAHAKTSGSLDGEASDSVSTSLKADGESTNSGLGSLSGTGIDFDGRSGHLGSQAPGLPAPSEADAIRDQISVIEHAGGLRNIAEHLLQEPANNILDNDLTASPDQFPVSNQASSSMTASSHSLISSPRVDASQEDQNRPSPTMKLLDTSRSAKFLTDAQKRIPKSSTPFRNIRYGLPTPPSSSRRSHSTNVVTAKSDPSSNVSPTELINVSRDQSLSPLLGKNEDRASEISPTRDLVSAFNEVRNLNERTDDVHDSIQTESSEQSWSGSTDTSFNHPALSADFEDAENAWLKWNHTQSVITTSSSWIKKKEENILGDGRAQFDGARSVEAPPTVETGNTSSRYEGQITDIIDSIDEIEFTWSDPWHTDEPYGDESDQRQKTGRDSEGHSSSIDRSTRETLRRRSMSTSSPMEALRGSSTYNASTAEPTVNASKFSLQQKSRSADAMRNNPLIQDSVISNHDLSRMCVRLVKQIIIYVYATLATASAILSIGFRKSIHIATTSLTATTTTTTTTPSVPFTGLASNIAIWQWLHFTTALIFLFLTYQVYLIRQYWYNANASQVREMVMGWREVQWESSVLRFLRWQLEIAIERHFGYGQPIHLT